MKLKKFRYFYPAQPTRVWAGAEAIDTMCNSDYIAEFKKNGWLLMLVRNEDGTFEAWTRHKTKSTIDISSYIPELEKLNWKGLCCIYIEFLDRRTKDIKDRMFLFDVQIWDSQLLTNKTFAERRKFLEFLTLPIATRYDWYKKGHMNGGKIQLSICFQVDTKNIQALYDEATGSQMDEGLVFKKLSGKLEVSNSRKNSKYQFKLKKVEDHCKGDYLKKKGYK